jgi:SLT domain-containing protein
LPHPDWTGNAAQAATSAGAALIASRSQLINAATDASASAAAGTQISRDATLQLQAIINDWGAAKASAAATPQPLRDSALIQAGQLRIAEAMGLISATADRYNAAAAAVRTARGTLPPATAPPPAAGSGGGDPPATADTDHPGAEPSTPIPTLDSQDSAAPPATQTPGAVDEGLIPAAAMPTGMPAAMMPSMGSPMGSMMPSMASPVGSMMPSMASPVGSMMPAGGGLSTLAGLGSQLSTPPTSTPTTTDADTTTQPRHRKATPGSVAAAIDAALDALGINDPAARARWHAGYDTLIDRESSGNAYAVNLRDSNAHGPIQADGAPAAASRGLTQITPENFNRYRLPSLPNDIYHPVSNIAADIRYVMDRHHVDPSGINLTANVQQANRHLPAKGH